MQNLLQSQSSEENVFSISQISMMIQNTLASKFDKITVKGEISGFKQAPSGHAYFNLKDDGAVLNAICWRGGISKLNFKPEDGLEVIVTGNLTTYPNKSNYQIICSDIRISGTGALMALLEDRKKKLAAEGLFESSRKRKIPYMPQCIGVITSPTGAVIKDILHRISDRFGVYVLIYPVAVQGENAANQIVEAINFFNTQLNKKIAGEVADIRIPDVLIVARGGGSIEDLWCFNEEIVVRAAANSHIPLISAVGHETDTTLIDYASDVRAPTPTAAAEIATPVKSDIISTILELKKRQYNAINRNIENLQRLLKARASGLISPSQRLNNMAQKLDDLNQRMNANINFIFKNNQIKLENLNNKFYSLNDKIFKFKQQKIEHLKSLLESYNYKNVLKRGFSIVKNSEGELIKSSNILKDGDKVVLELYDGTKNAIIKNSFDNNLAESNSDKKPTRNQKTIQKEVQNSKSSSQGSLF